MPIKSKSQQRLMYAAASGKVPGLSKKVARKYISETPREAYEDMPERRPAKRIVVRRKKGGK
jgi:uncharacterized Zn finger protein